jgi:hypothetical protein
MPSTDRAAIRAFISGQRDLLESAQLTGTLARTKLDVIDAAEVALAPVTDHRDKLLAMVRQELDAFCDDMRLASVTVQQQVERKGPKRWGLAVASAIGATIATLILMVSILGDGPDAALLGFGIPIAVGVFVLFKVH